MININSGFSMGSSEPIDARIILSKTEMLTINENIFPNKYFCVCEDDGKIYTFDKSNSIDSETGKFRPIDESFNTWSGTQAEYSAIADTLAEGTIVTITDDTVEIIDDSTSSTSRTYSSSKINSLLGDIETALDSIIGGD